MADRRPARATTRSGPTPRPDHGPNPALVPVQGLVLAQLQRLRSDLPGVVACLVASSDGLLIAEQAADLEPTRIAALTSTLTGLAAHAVQATERGDLLDAVVRGTLGNLAVFAIGNTAVLAVVADSDVTVAWLHVKTRPVVDELVRLSDRFDRFFTPEPS